MPRSFSRPRRLALAAAALATTGCCRAAVAAPTDGLGQFVGDWTCAGHFVSNGRPIGARLAIRLDAATNALIVRHDDVPPGGYHSLEIWTAMKAGGYRAALSDAYSGMRWFSAPARQGSALVWSRPADAAPIEQFAYTLDAGGGMRIDWSIARKDGTLTLGDTLACRRAPAPGGAPGSD